MSLPVEVEDLKAFWKYFKEGHDKNYKAIWELIDANTKAFDKVGLEREKDEEKRCTVEEVVRREEALEVAKKAILA